MAEMKLDIVTAEQSIWSGDVDMVIAPGVEGQMGILPGHTPLMTMLSPGELRIRQGGEESSIVVTGGFLEIRPDRVIVLADAAERAEEIDMERALEARRRAEERIAQGSTGGLTEERAKAALLRAMVRLQVAEKTRRRKRTH